VLLTPRFGRRSNSGSLPCQYSAATKAMLLHSRLPDRRRFMVASCKHAHSGSTGKWDQQQPRCHQSALPISPPPPRPHCCLLNCAVCLHPVGCRSPSAGARLSTVSCSCQCGVGHDQLRHARCRPVLLSAVAAEAQLSSSVAASTAVGQLLRLLLRQSDMCWFVTSCGRLCSLCSMLLDQHSTESHCL
jgi:hypothetical protein